MTTLPSAGPLAGRWVRLDLLGEPDLDEMYPILADPAVYAHGYVMHHRPGSVADARDLARSVFLAQQGEADGQGGGRTTYAIRLNQDGDLGKLGAQREGVMRRHLKREDGTFRDTVVYSVLIDEWPAVRSRLLARLAR